MKERTVKCRLVASYDQDTHEFTTAAVAFIGHKSKRVNIQS